MKNKLSGGKHYETTLDYLIEGFQLISYDWRYLYVNDAVVKQSKYSRKELLGYTMMEKYPGIENTELFRTLSQCMKERKTTCFENEFNFPDGSKGWFELRIEPVPEGLFILSIDITNRKAAELARQEHVKKLEEMIFMVSHKVRIPVANILGISAMLEGKITSQEELGKIAEHILYSAHSLDDFTKELTTFIHAQHLDAQKSVENF